MPNNYKKEYIKKYYKEHRDKIIERSKKHYINNKDKKKEYDKEYRKKHRFKTRINSKKYYKKNKYKRKEYILKNKNRIREYGLKKRFDTTLDEYNKIFNEQNGKCKICGKHQTELTKSLAIDHNHITGKIRGLLCMNCNCVLGLVKDSIEILEKSKLYLQSNG